MTPIREPQLGGSQAFVSDLAQGLAGRGHHVEVFASSGSSIPGVTVVDTGVDSADLAHALYRSDGSSPDGASDAMREAFARAWAIAGEGGHDLVHNHAFDAPAIELARARRVVHTLHLPPDAAIAAALHEHPATVACVSGPHAEAWSRLVPVDAVLRPGVPVDRIPVGDGGERVLFAGRLSPEKGAAEAVEIARRAGVGIEVYGDPYDPEYAASIAARPALPRTRLWEVMGAARAVLCPVTWDEPFGLVPAEAQAAGTPVVGFRRGGLVEVVDDGRTGALVPPGDLGAAALAVRDAATFDRAGCRAHAERNLSLEASLDAHEELYEKVVA